MGIGAVGKGRGGGRGERVDVEGGGGGGKRDQPSQERGGRQGSLPPSRLEPASAWMRLDQLYGAEGV